ncbi:pilus assembly protein N-terminal domain-containing protein [Myxococcus sp. K15C18031901]|uniref:pilus assembly protein N-terminal domain-containing protein n=1 Tax=Myxococcus dinghuensis TaxID=2906761 RepID=UPI0020A7111C|nr:pilus assembly protein N-terminal domain-containing protein [Myxococcus dinghuensis]MCP3102522.1 pilus assembly protein N-terminal domain-containing protein [Myxococcus dinghuensis]
MRNGLMGIAMMALTLVGTVAGADERIQLDVGQTKVLTVKKLKRLAIGDPEVAQVKMGSEAGQVSLTGREAGTTKLITWDENDSLRAFDIVVSQDTGSKAATPAN